MTRWQDVADAVPGFATAVVASFEAGRHKTLATVRADGSPRISGLECEFVDGDLRFGMMPRSRKGDDLRREPRIAIHAPTSHPGEGREGEWAGEAKIAGRALPAGPIQGADGQPAGQWFTVDISEAVVTRLNGDGTRLVIETWTPTGGLRVVERD